MSISSMPGCASACEGIALAAKGRDNMALLGLPTAGLTTANEALPPNRDFRLR